MLNLNSEILKIIPQIKQHGPQAVVEQLVQQKFPNNPMIQQMLQMGY